MQKAIGGSGIDFVNYYNKTIDNNILVIGSTQSVDDDAIGNHGNYDVLVMKMTMDGVVLWKKCLGGNSREDFSGYYYDDIDGSLLLNITTYSNNGDVSGNHGGADAWIVKLNNAGDVLWKKCIGGTNTDYLVSITKVSLGDYILVGSTSSNDGDVTGNHGLSDVWVCKLSTNGNLIWQHCYGGSQSESIGTLYSINAVIKASDNNIIITSSTASNDGDVSGFNGGANDIWVFKITESNGNLQWQQCIGGNNTENQADICESALGDIYVYGQTQSPNLLGFHNPSAANTRDLLLVKLNTNGILQWKKCFGQDDVDNAYRLEKTGDNGVVISGAVFGNGGDVSGWHGYDDIWLAKIRSDASIEWQRTLGGSYADDIDGSNYAFVFYGKGGLTKTTDHGWLISGITASYDGDTIGNTDTSYYNSWATFFKGNIWMIKLDSIGNLQWQRSLGGSRHDAPIGSPIQIGNDEFIIGGNVKSNDGNISGGHNDFSDMWICRVGLVSTIKGNLYLDNNDNNIHDISEPFFKDAIVRSIKPGYTNSSIASNGSFVNEVDTGVYSTVCLPYKNYYTVAPLSKTTVFNNYGMVDSFDFALKPIPEKKDLVINIIPLERARPGTICTYKILFKNAGTEPIPFGTISFTKDSRTTFLSSWPAYSGINGDTLKWNFINLLPLDTASILLKLQLNIPPSLSNGDTLHYYVAIDPLTNDEAPADNTSILNQRVFFSYDPNDKQEKHGGYLTKKHVDNGELLQYTIQFQNTGNDTAFKVTIRDTLSEKLDWGSMQMISSSHPYQLNLKSKYCSWTFDSIRLPDSNVNEPASHGYITFNIKPKASVRTGDIIANNASIYFDYNFPIQTNTHNTFIKGEIFDLTGSNPFEFGIYPQPVKGDFTMRIRGYLSGSLSYSVYDMQGRFILKKSEGNVYTDLISIPIKNINLPSGMYVLKVQIGNRSSQSKFILL